jgi:CubicO group peptidase (beta-lactamase class C family)
VAQNGKVIYYKAFGFHTYDSITPVKTTDIYDLASITKIAATVPAIMWLYERKSINLSQHLSRYLPFFDKYDKGKIVIRDLLTHQARLQSFMPFYMNTLRYENSDGKHAKNIPSQATSVKSGEAAFSNSKTRYIEGLYSRFPKPGYELKVADSLYLINSYQDTIYEAIYNSKLNKINGYYYSDLGFMLLYKLVMSKIDKPFDCWLDSALYKPLGAKTLGFLPLGRNDRNEIVPTENDLIFRKQIVQGYVHDQTCAMLGGVCGHAGLFANANDLGKLMQMYLQKGEYGDLKYFNSKTINLFTSRPYYKTGNRRGLGFDKPEPSLSKQSPVARCVSDLSYGHSGFTGTMTWVDPEKQLVYIFLSNRVYPNADNNKLVEMNVRTRIQEVIYKALIH